LINSSALAPKSEVLGILALLRETGSILGELNLRPVTFWVPIWMPNRSTECIKSQWGGFVNCTAELEPFSLSKKAAPPLDF
jgi:hypothetical protein